MQSYIFCHRLMRRPGGLQDLILHLSERPFGLSTSRLLLSLFPDVYSIVGIFPFMGFLFYKVHCPTPWILGKTSRALLRYWWLSFDYLGLKFLKEAPKFSSNLMTIYAQSGGFILFNLLCGLQYCCRVAVHLTTLLWRSFFGIFLFPWFPVQQGLRSSWKDWYETASDVPGSIIPTFWFRRSMTKKSSMGCLNFSLFGFALCPSFLALYRGGDN